jgi:hypothetical protein
MLAKSKFINNILSHPFDHSIISIMISEWTHSSQYQSLIHSIYRQDDFMKKEGNACQIQEAICLKLAIAILALAMLPCINSMHERFSEKTTKLRQLSRIVSSNA